MRSLILLAGLCCSLVLAAAEGWPNYGGPGGSCATPADGSPMIDAWIDARRVWQSDQAIPDGQAGDARKPFRDGALRISGGYASPICNAEAVYLQYYLPAGEPDAELVAEHGEAVADKFRIEADEVIHCFDASDGSTRWRTVLPRTSLNMQAFTKAGPSQTPCLGDGRLYAQLNGGLVVALDAQTGTELWRTATPRHALQEAYRTQAREQRRLAGFNRDFVSSPLYHAGILVFNDHLHCKVSPPGGGETDYHYDLPSNLIALDAATGSERWRLPGGISNTSQPLVWQDGADDWLVVDGGDMVRCLDLHDGTEAWHIAETDGGRLLIDGDILVVGHRAGKKERWLAGYRLAAAGPTPLWTQRDHGRPQHLAARNGILYADDRQGSLIALGLDDGALRGRAPSTVETHFGCYPILVGSRIVCAGSDSDRIHLYDAQDPESLALLDHHALPHAWGYTMPILPAAHAGRIYLREHDRLSCWDLRAQPGVDRGTLQLTVPAGLLDDGEAFTTRLRLRDGVLRPGLSRRGELALTAAGTAATWDGDTLRGDLDLTTPAGGVETYRVTARRDQAGLQGQIAPVVVPFAEPLPLAGRAAVIERERWMPSCTAVVKLAEATRTRGGEASHLLLFVTVEDGRLASLSAIADRTVKSWPAIDHEMALGPEGRLQGTLRVRYRPDRWSTALVQEGSQVAATYQLDVPLGSADAAGSFTGSWGVEWHEQRPLIGEVLP